MVFTRRHQKQILAGLYVREAKRLEKKKVKLIKSLNTLFETYMAVSALKIKVERKYDDVFEKYCKVANMLDHSTLNKATDVDEDDDDMFFE